MKKTYRNALRSKRLIRQAFITLLSKKELHQITVVDIVELADLSRNTFYAHYQDVYAVMEEYQQEMQQALLTGLDEVLSQQPFDSILPLLTKMAEIIDQNKSDYQVLITCSQTPAFLKSLQQFFQQWTLQNIDRLPLHDKSGFLLFVNLFGAGCSALVQQYLLGDTTLTAAQLVQELLRIYHHGVRLYQ